MDIELLTLTTDDIAYITTIFNKENATFALFGIFQIAFVLNVITGDVKHNTANYHYREFPN